MNPEACCSSSCCYSSLQRTVRNYSRLSFVIRILSKLLPSFFCHNDGLFRKPTSPPLPLMRDFFLKSPRPSLPLKRAPPLFPSPFPLRGQEMCQPPYSVLKPLRYKVGGPSEVYASSRAAVFCAGINPLSLKDLLRGCLVDAKGLLDDAVTTENLPICKSGVKKCRDSLLFRKEIVFLQQ